MGLGGLARNVLNRIGVDIYRYPMKTSRGYARGLALNYLGINLVLDVGANIGQYVDELTEFGYRGRIASFEPLSKEFAQLQARAKARPGWECRQVALGETEGTTQINIAGTFSSILTKKQGAEESVTWTASGVEEIKLARLDTLWPELHRPGDRVYMKMDVQGYEMQVLNGAPQALKQIAAVEMEMSLSPLYSGQPTYREMQAFMEGQGFTLWSLHPGARNMENGRLLEMDGTFVRAQT
jgi:FkbM family methyltransferase